MARALARAFAALVALCVLVGADARSLKQLSLGSITVTHDDGTTTVPLRPSRVAVINFSLLDIIDSLGVGSSVVAIPRSICPLYLSQYDNDAVYDVGSVSGQNPELVAAAQPDLILLGASSARAYANFSDIAPTVSLSINQSDYNATITNVVTTLAQIFKKEELAASQLAEIYERSRNTTEAAQSSGETTLVLMVSGSETYAFGAGSSLDMYYGYFGLNPALAADGSNFQAQMVSNEEIAAVNPDSLLIIDRGAAMGGNGTDGVELGHARLNDPTFLAIPAVANGKAYYLRGDHIYLSSGGLLTLNYIADRIEAAQAGIPGIVSVAETTGDSVWVLRNAERLVVLGLGLLDTVDALNLTRYVVGAPQSEVPDYLATFRAPGIVDVGTQAEPNVTAVVVADPDVILIGEEALPYREQLEVVAPVVMLGANHTRPVESVEQGARSLAELFGVAEAAERQIADLDEYVQAVRANATAAGTQLTIAINGTTIRAFGSDQRYSLITDTLGFATVPGFDYGSDLDGQEITLERISSLDPDYLFVIDLGALGNASADGGLAHTVLDALANTTAFENGRVYYLDPARWHAVENGLSTARYRTEEVAAALSGPSIVEVTWNGVSTFVPINPQRVIVFDYGILDTLNALGVTDEIIGVPSPSSLPAYLSDYSGRTDVGGLKSADLEVSAALNPDLVILTGRASGFLDNYTTIAPTIVLGVNNTDTVNSFPAQVRALASIFDRAERAEQLLAGWEARVEEVKSLADDNSTIVVMTSNGSLTMMGAGSRFSFVFDVFGFTPAEATTSEAHGDDSSVAQLRAMNPDRIIAVDRGMATGGDASTEQVHTLLSDDDVLATQAAQNLAIYEVDAFRWYMIGQGLQNYNMTADELQKALTSPGLVNVTDAVGPTLVPFVPASVVVLDIGLVDSLHALGVGYRIVGVPSSWIPDTHRAYRQTNITNVGSLFEPDYETIAALNPDLILVGTRTAGLKANLTAFAPTLDLTVSNSDWAQGVRRVAAVLGSVFNVSDAADDLVVEIEDLVVEAREAYDADPLRALTLLVSGETITTYGVGSRFGFIHNDIGVHSIADASEATHGQPITLQEIGDLDPELIFVVDRGAATSMDGDLAHVTLDSSIINETTAVQNGRVQYLDGFRWYIIGSTGLHNVKVMLEEVLEGIKYPGIINVHHNKGTTWVRRHPKRIAVFDVGALDTLDALGVGRYVRGTVSATIPSWLSGYAALESVGTLFVADMGTLMEIHPDLIIVGMRSSSIYDQVRSVAPTVDMTVGNVDQWGIAQNRILALAELWNVTDVANEKVETINEKITALQSIAPNAGKSIMAMVNGGNIGLFGPGSRFGQLFDVFGIESVIDGASADNPNNKTNLELLAELNPDSVFWMDRGVAVDSGGALVHLTINAPELADTNFVQSGRVYQVHASRWYILALSGLNNWEGMVDEVTSALSSGA